MKTPPIMSQKGRSCDVRGAVAAHGVVTLAEEAEGCRLTKRLVGGARCHKPPCVALALLAFPSVRDYASEREAQRYSM